MSASVVPEGIGNGLKSKTKTLVRNSESYKELSTGTPTSERPSSGNQDHRMAILNFSKNDLLQLLGLLEAELEARELVISSLKSERSNILQPSSNHHKRYTLHNPYAALSRDKDDKGTQEDGKKTPEADPVIILQTMVDRHKKVEEQMKQQLEDLSKNHQQVLKELALERQKHAQETAHGDDVTYLLEKDRERLSQQVDFEKAQQKKMERETKRAQSVLIEERKKHMSVVKALLDEHRYLQNELAEALQRLEQADCEAHACKVDARKAMAMLSEERQKAEKREAEIERQISEFDIEREQLVGKLKREESRTKKLQETLDEANGRVSELEHVLELSRELSQKDSSSDNVTRTKSAELKGTEDNNSSGPLSYRPKSSTFPSSTSGQANLTRSSKLFAPRGFKSPLRTSESSSGSSEELSSPNTQKINVRTKNRSSGDFAAKRGSNDSLERISGDETVIDVHSTSVSIKPKVASITPSRRTTEAARKGLSPANSVDKLATKERSSTPTDLTKISKIPAMTKKVVTVGVVSPQQSRKVAELEVSTISKTPEVNHSQDSADSISKPLPRPNNFTKSATVDTSAEVISKQKDALSPTSPPGRPILPYTTFSGVNVKAKAAQLISPSAKKNIMAGSSSSAAGMKGAAPLPPPPTPVGNSKLASQVNGTISTGDLGSTNTSPPGLHGTKRASPRGTPPPVPNKPTLIPQKLAASTTTPSPLSTSVTSSPSLSSQGTKSSTTPPPPPPPPIVNKRPDSLVEARKLFYANKHGSVTCDNPNSVHVRSTTTHNINSNNSNNYRSSSDVFDIDVPPSLDRFPAAPVPVKGILG